MYNTKRLNGINSLKDKNNCTQESISSLFQYLLFLTVLGLSVVPKQRKELYEIPVYNKRIKNKPVHYRLYLSYR